MSNDKKADRVNAGEVPELNDISDTVVLQQSRCGGGRQCHYLRHFALRDQLLSVRGEGGELMGAAFPLASRTKTS
jgi:hypothetical protein